MYIYFNRNTLEYQRDARQTNNAEILTLLGLLYFIEVKKSAHGNLEEVWVKESDFALP